MEGTLSLLCVCTRDTHTHTFWCLEPLKCASKASLLVHTTSHTVHWKEELPVGAETGPDATFFLWALPSSVSCRSKEEKKNGGGGKGRWMDGWEGERERQIHR